MPLVQGDESSREQLERLKDLLVERQSAAIDVTAAAIEQGSNLTRTSGRSSSPTFNRHGPKAGSRAQPAEYTQFQNYESAQIFRGATTDLQRGLTAFRLR